MTAATITEYVNIASPNIELVILSMTDGYTYTSKKFTTVKAAYPIWLADTDGYANVTISANVVTVNMNGTSASAVALLLFGVKN